MNESDLISRGFMAGQQFSMATEHQLLANLPSQLGVYAVILANLEQRLLGSSNIGYIGRAVNQNGLRGRVRQYFHPGPTQSTNIAMKKRFSDRTLELRIGFVICVNAAAAKRLESHLLIEFESLHGELPPYNRKRALNSLSRILDE